jgi:hypothetical protein
VGDDEINNKLIAALKDYAINIWPPIWKKSRKNSTLFSIYLLTQIL